MSRKELVQATIEKLRGVIKSMHAGLKFPLAELTLSPPQIRIFFLISKSQAGISVKELAEKIKVTPGAITQFVDTLVEKGLVRREEDPHDRRSLRIKLTPAGERKVHRFEQDYFEAACRIFAVLSDSEIEQLLGILTRLESTAGKGNGEE